MTTGCPSSVGRSRLCVLIAGALAITHDRPWQHWREGEQGDWPFYVAAAVGVFGGMAPVTLPSRFMPQSPMTTWMSQIGQYVSVLSGFIVVIPGNRRMQRRKGALPGLRLRPPRQPRPVSRVRHAREVTVAADRSGTMLSRCVASPFTRLGSARRSHSFCAWRRATLGQELLRYGLHLRAHGRPGRSRDARRRRLAIRPLGNDVTSSCRRAQTGHCSRSAAWGREQIEADSLFFRSRHADLFGFHFFRDNPHLPSDWLAVVPLAFPTLLLALCPAAWIARDVRRRGRRRRELCSACGYDLHSPDRCPECGTPVT